MVSPIASPKDVNRTWLEGVLKQKLMTEVKIDSWNMKLHKDSEGCLSEMGFVDVVYIGSEGDKEEVSLVIKYLPKDVEAT